MICEKSFLIQNLINYHAFIVEKRTRNIQYINNLLKQTQKLKKKDFAVFSNQREYTLNFYSCLKKKKDLFNITTTQKNKNIKKL